MSWCSIANRDTTLQYTLSTKGRKAPPPPPPNEILGELKRGQCEPLSYSQTFANTLIGRDTVRTFARGSFVPQLRDELFRLMSMHDEDEVVTLVPLSCVRGGNTTMHKNDAIRELRYDLPATYYHQFINFELF